MPDDKSGLISGKHTHRHKDGSPWAKGNFLDGKMTGYWEWFRKPEDKNKDGTRMRSGYFEKGKQVGEWKTYDKNGKVVKVTNMDTK